MLFRAVFWVGFVALLMPRDSGHGPSSVAEPAGNCRSCESASTGLQSMLLDRLAAVKEDIEAAERARARAC